MKISKMSFTATIPTGQYANIQPSVEFSDIEDGDKASELGMKFINDLYTRFSSLGALRENKIVVKTSTDKINEVLG